MVAAAARGEFIKASAPATFPSGGGAIVVSIHLPEDIRARAEAIPLDRLNSFEARRLARYDVPRLLAIAEAASVRGGPAGTDVGHWWKGNVHWYDPASTPTPGCPLCAALAALDEGQE